MLVLYIVMILAGLFSTGWGIWASHRCSGKKSLLGAILAPLGLVIALLGVLLVCVPNFFSG